MDDAGSGIVVELTASWPDGVSRTLRRRADRYSSGVGSIGVCGFPALAGAVRVAVHVLAPCRVKLEGGWPASLQELTLSAAARGCLVSVNTGAFAGLPALARVALAVPLVAVGPDAFRDCASLRVFECAGTGYVFGDRAFAGAPLVALDVPGLVGAGAGAFKGCASLGEVNAPALVEAGFACFEGCVTLRRLVVSPDIERFSNRMCNRCAQLEAVVVGEGRPPNDLRPAIKLAVIGRQAFEGCARLGAGGHPVVLPPSAHTCGESAFAGCASLPGLICDATVLKRRALQGTVSLGEAVVGSALAEAFIDSGVQKIVIRGGGVGLSACAGCLRLESVIFVGKPPRRVDERAFDGCTALTEVKIWGPETRSCATASYGCTFDTWCFRGCTSLREVNLATTKRLGLGAFEDCCSLERVTIRGGSARIGPQVFRGCSSLATVVLPPRFCDVGIEAFVNCTSLSVVEFPPTLCMLPDRVFLGCSALRAVVASRVRVVHGDTFAGCAELSFLVAASDVACYDETQGLPPHLHPVADALGHCPRLGGPTPNTEAAVVTARRLDFWTTPRPLPGGGGGGYDHLGLPRFRREWVRFVMVVLQRLRLPSVVFKIVLGYIRRHELGIAADAAAVRRGNARLAQALEWPSDDDDDDDAAAM